MQVQIWRELPKLSPLSLFSVGGMETGTIVEYKACKRNSVANLELKAFAKAFPVSNMLVPQFLRKRIVLATTFQESSRAQARLTKRCRGYYSYHIPFLSLCPCKLCNVFHSVAGKASNGSFPRCSHLFKVCVCVQDHHTLDDVLILCCMLLYHLGA